MKINFHELSVSEKIFLHNLKKKNTDLKILLKYSFVELIAKGSIIIKEDIIKDSIGNASTYFITVNNRMDYTKSKLNDGLSVLFKLILENKHKWVSLNEFVNSISHFISNIFRNSNKKYKYERYIINSLVKKGLLKKVFFQVRLSEDGLKMLQENTLLKNEDSISELKNDMLSIIKNNHNLDIENVLEAFDELLLSREIRVGGGFVSAIGELGNTYPRPLNLV